jgi:hypothetical protein
MGGTDSPWGGDQMGAGIGDPNNPMNNVSKFQFIVRSSTTKRRVTPDPKQGQCVQMGETVFLQNYDLDNRYLSGSLGARSATGALAYESVEALNLELNNIMRYKWEIQSSDYFEPPR